MITGNLFKRWRYRFFAPDLLQRETYESFRRFLEYDHRCHELIADFQDLLFKGRPSEWTKVMALYDQLSEAIGALVGEFKSISPRVGSDLAIYFKKFDSYCRFLLAGEANISGPPHVICLSDATIQQKCTGNKARNLALLFQKLEYCVPTGFVVTTNSWNAVVEYNGLRPQINRCLLTLDPDDNSSLQAVSRSLMSLVLGAEIPPEINKALQKAIDDLLAGIMAEEKGRFAVRSSAVNEDGYHSFAGQYHSVLNVLPEDIFSKYLEVVASKYTPSSLLYRIGAGISDEEAPMAVLVLEMIKAKSAGVIYTADPERVEKDTLFIHSVKGTGEKLVSGETIPHLLSFRKEALSPVLCSFSRGPINRNEAEKLAGMAVEIESFFGCPQDIEWAIDDSGPVILQSRPLQTSHSAVVDSIDDVGRDSLPLLYHGGVTAARGCGSGRAFLLRADSDPDYLPADVVLVVDNTPSSLILFLAKCRAVVATGGSVACHFATICRERNIPLIVAAREVKKYISADLLITVDAGRQKVFKGRDAGLADRDSILKVREQYPYFRRLQAICDFIAPLTLLDPDADSFIADGCRSFHDILRFSHEKAVRAMFSIGLSGSRKGYRKKLATTLPFELYLVDVDAGHDQQESCSSLAIEDVKSTPFHALWHGLTHPSIIWDDHVYYNWKEYDDAALSDGFAFKNSTESASYAVYGQDYLNLNMRFGYHFTVVDTLCGEKSAQNYCSIRFAGGGGTFAGRYFRLQFIETILRETGFQVSCKTDLLDGKIEALPADQMIECLRTLGRMLGTSKQMDMVFRDEESVATHLELFFSQ